MRYTAKDIGEIVRKTRKNLGVTQKALALTSGTGLRFVIDLEKGKETCQLGKVLTVLNTLGIGISLAPPSVPEKKGVTDGENPRCISSQRTRRPPHSG